MGGNSITGSNLLYQYGLGEYCKKRLQLELPSGSLKVARVIAQHRDLYSIITETGERRARMSGAFLGRGIEKDSYPVVGDFVLVKDGGNGNGNIDIGADIDIDVGVDSVCIITEVLDRNSLLERGSEWLRVGEKRPIAANVDTAFIVTSLNNDLRIKRIDRYLSLIYQSGIKPVILLTKLDLCETPETPLMVKEHYKNTETIALSAVTGENLDLLRDKLKPCETAIFLGMSGVGKSTLVNALFGSEVMKTGEIRTDDSRGRHTTTHKELCLLPNGTLIIDTPGIRSIDIGDANEGVSLAFEDIKELAGQCQYSDCTHTREPQCRIRSAIKSGLLSRERYESYQKLIRNENRERKIEKLVANRIQKANSKRSYSKKSKYED